MFLHSYKSKKIIVTGHTGFKGSWLSFILFLFGAKVYGISDKKLKGNSLFKVLKLEKKISSSFININNYSELKKKFLEIKPDFIFHLAAESIVSRALEDPLNTFKTNIIGTANILDILNEFNHFCICIFITSDKCYENKEINRSYKENDYLGGADPYSASKAGAEIIISSMYRSFLKNKRNLKIGICRAGNVIGGGDWSPNRLIPDVIRSIENHKLLQVRNPNSTRPWQHVLDPLSGYLKLGYLLYFKKFSSGEAFNFGPKPNSKYNVKRVLEEISKIHTLNYEINSDYKIKEAKLLSLNSNKALKKLGWRCAYGIKKTINKTINWYLFFNKFPNKIEEYTRNQINEFFYK